jgi:hypothetical protein
MVSETNKIKSADIAELNNLMFSDREILESKESILNRLNSLKHAQKVSMSYKLKSKIFFETSDGPRYIESTIWNINPTHVELIAGVSIPINCIWEVHSF